MTKQLIRNDVQKCYDEQLKKCLQLSWQSNSKLNALILLLDDATSVNNIMNLIKTPKKSDINKNTFLLNANFQQKRSGDWLQVLACLLLKSRPLKGISQLGGPAIENIEKMTGLNFHPNLTDASHLESTGIDTTVWTLLQ